MKKTLFIAYGFVDKYGLLSPSKHKKDVPLTYKSLERAFRKLRRIKSNA